MNTYFVTGATGFVGRRLAEGLLRRPRCERVYALVRPQSADKPGKHDKPTPVSGTITSPIDAERVDRVAHPAALHDSTSPEEAHHAVNVEGTRRVVEYAARTGSGLLHHVSSTVVAGDSRGTFTEDDFDRGRHLPSPCHATRHAAMRERRFGHIVTISTMGVQINTPRFSAYPASKSAEPARKAAPRTVRSLLHPGFRAMPEKGSPRTSPPPGVAAGVTRLVLRAAR